MESTPDPRDWGNLDYLVKYIGEIRSAVGVARQVVARSGSRAVFVDDDVFASAGVQTVQRIGEALKKIEHFLRGLDEQGKHPSKNPPPFNLDDFNEDFPKVDFKKWIRARDFLSHGYADLDPNITWDTLADDIEPLDAALRLETWDI